MPAYIGSFAGSFMQSFLAARASRMAEQNQRFMQAYYTYLMKNNNYDPQSGKYWDPASGKFSSPIFVAPESADSKAFREGTANYDKGSVGTKGFNQAGANMVYKTLTDRGVPKEAAAGFVGSMAEESAGFNPNARNPNDAGPGRDSIGWGQWNKERLDGPNGLYAVTGKSNWRDLTDEDNDKYFAHELDNTPVGQKTIQQLKGASSVEQGASIGANTYEGSRVGPTQHMDVRIGGGQQFLRTLATQPDTAKEVTPKSNTPTQTKSAPSALPGGSVKSASLDPNAGFQALADRQAQAKQIAGQPAAPGALPIGSPAPATPPPRPVAGTAPPTPTPAAPSPVVAIPTAPQAQGEYQPQTGNAKAAQWIPNRGPNPPIGGPLARPVAAPVAASPTVPPIGSPAPATPPPRPMPPGAIPLPGTAPTAPAPAAPAQPQQPAPDVTKGLADANAQREAMAQAQLAAATQRRPNDGQDTIAAAKGGAIPVMRYYGAGGVASPAAAASSESGFGQGNGSPATASPLLYANNSMANAASPKYGPGAIQTLMTNLEYPNGGAPAGFSGTHTSTPGELSAWNALTPDQQTWMNTARADQVADLSSSPQMMQMMYSQLGAAPPGTPAAAATPVAPAAAPTAIPTSAATIVPAQTAVNPAAGGVPASTTTTGSNIPLGTLKSTANTTVNGASNPNFSGVTDYNIDAMDQTTANNRNNVAGAVSSSLLELGGPIEYDGGGSVAGMPPGMPQQQTIPPIYYNSATYSQYGAPVGRGVSAASAPAYAAASVPTYAHGGAVAYDDGGDVQPDPMQPQEVAMNDPSMDQTQPQQMAMSTFPHAVHTGIPMPKATAPKVTIPHIPSMHLPGGRGAAPKPQPEHFGNPNENMEPVGEPPQQMPADAPAWAPQIEDGYGNPSHGLMDAITDGLHAIGQALGMGGPSQPNQPQGAIPGDASVSANQRAFARGEGAMTPSQANQVYQIVDPGQSLDTAMRNLAGLEAVHNQHLLDGDYDGAGKVAASMLMYAQKMSAKYGDEAVKRFQQGDIDKALAAMKNAADMIPDGRKLHLEKTDDGKIDVAITNMRNVVEWKQTMAPKDILSYAVKAQNGSLYWDALETQAAKYDPEYKEMAKQKAADAQAAQENQALEYMARGRGGQGAGQGAGAPPAPQQVQPPQAQPIATPQSNLPPPPGVPEGQWHAGGTPSGPVIPAPADTQAIPTSGVIPQQQGGEDWRPPNYAQLSPQFQRQLLTDHLTQMRQQQQDKTLDQREQFTAAQQMERERYTNQQAGRKEATTQRMADLKEKAARSRAANAPMNPTELAKSFEVSPPSQYLASAPSFSNVFGKDPKQAAQAMDTTFGQDGTHALASAVWNTKGLNPRAQTEDVAEAVAGLATNRYAIDGSQAKEINDEYGKRYQFSFGTKGQDGKIQPMGTLVMTDQDLQQLNRLKSMYTQKNAPPAARPDAPAYPGNMGLPAQPQSAPYKGLVQQPNRPQQAIPPLINRVPNSQVPQQYRDMFPELNQPDQ